MVLKKITEAQTAIVNTVYRRRSYLILKVILEEYNIIVY